MSEQITRGPDWGGWTATDPVAALFEIAKALNRIAAALEQENQLTAAAQGDS